MREQDFQNIPGLSNSLMSFALKLTKNMQEAEDLMQETWLKALIHKDKFQNGTNFRAWLYTILKNSFLNNRKKVSYRRTVFEEPQAMQEFNTAQSTVSNEAPQSIALEEIQCAIDDLGMIYQIPFLMHYQGYKYKEIAKEMDIPVGTVKNRIHIARRKLKASLSHHVEEV